MLRMFPPEWMDKMKRPSSLSLLADERSALLVELDLPFLDEPLHALDLLADLRREFRR